VIFCMGGISIFVAAEGDFGELAQLARASAWHVEGHRFDSGILHKRLSVKTTFFYFE
jgi:hypothetical protein